VHQLLPFIVSGIATGAIYGLAGTGLVLTYKTSGIFNFGYGALATAAAYFYYWLTNSEHLDWKIAVVLSVLIGGIVMGAVMEVIARQLSVQSTSMKIVGTVGLIVLVEGLVTIKFGPDAINVRQFIPKGQQTFTILGTHVSYAQLTIAVIAVLAVAALYLLFRFARMGLAMRAVVDDADLLDTKGTDPVAVRRVAWIIGSIFAAASGVLLAPLIGLQPIALTFLVVQAFGAAAIGTFTSIPITFLGGVAIGIAADVSKKYVLDVGWLTGLPASLPFIVLVVVLLVTPRRRLVRPSLIEARPPLQWRSPVLVRLVVGVIVLVPLLFVPGLVGTKLVFWMTALSQVVLFLSLGLLVRTSGQVSLCQTAFAAIGAVAFSQFAHGLGIPWLVAALLAAFVAVPVGALVAIPAIRLSGLFLALATFGFGIMVEQLFYGRNFMFSQTTTGRRMPRPSFATSDRHFYYIILASVVVTALLMVAIHRARLGRMLRGMSDSPLAVSILGLTTNVTRVLVFCISAFLAAFAGILYGSSLGVVSSTDPFYASFTSLTLIAVLALAPFAEPWYAVFAGLTALIPGYLTGSKVPYWMNVVFGVFAVIIAMQGGPRPMPLRLQAFFDRVGRRPARRPHGLEPAVASPPTPSRPAPRRAGLEVEHLTVAFGGLVAVDDVSFKAPLSRITGLIGPNGAGKTTTFNACSGLNRPSRGVVRFHGEDVSHMSPAQRGRRGLGRTFQIIELCESLSVAENVALGREAALAGGRVTTQIISTRKDDKIVRDRAQEAMALCGIADLASVQAAKLSTGQRRLVELARCIAGQFDLLLLDEPSSGLDRTETEKFGTVINRVVDERGIGVLLVEHDMSLVMRVCEHIYVLDFGELIFEGDPATLASSDIVRAAYLGAEDFTVATAGQERAQ
jgi:ABC-type branched-subunit amino acid transport system ATPase component/branched-subunit amino acid ABC-type transport system permease component